VQLPLQSDRSRVGPRFLRAFLFLALLAVPALGSAAVPTGWQKILIPATGSYYWLYVPPTLDTTRPAPLVLFFHGSGASPADYRPLVAPSADLTGCVVAMPKSASSIGWGTGNDAQTVSETLRMIRATLPIDDRRIAVAGHSAGGAWAYLLAYGSSSYSAVFTLSASFYSVTSLADSHYKPPIHMYYGTTDPNYATARPRLEAQWGALGVSWDEDVETGFGHNNWPDSSMASGFRFLVGKSRPAEGCTPDATHFCLQKGRFLVEVSVDADGVTRQGQTVPGASPDSGLFWFFSSNNWELLVKVLDGCGLNDRYWVYAAGATDVHFVLTVTDTLTGSVARYENPAGKPAVAITDANAFQTCP